jgi:hypothetical protein
MDPTAQPSLKTSLAAWFSRAGERAPLEIKLFGASSAQASYILDLISNSRFNIVSLIILLAHRDSDILKRPHMDPLPMMETMTIVLENYVTGSRPVEPTLHLTDNFPKVRELRVANFGSPNRIFPTVLSHSTLGRLFLRKVVFTTEGLAYFLCRLPRLQQPHLSGCLPLSPLDELAAPYVHPSVTDLEFTDASPEGLFNHRVFPKLNRGALSSIENDTSGNAGRLLGAFMQRCGGCCAFAIRSRLC